MFGGFSIEEEHKEDVVTLSLSGELDTAHTGEVDAAIARNADAERLVIDTTGLDFIDSAGLSSLIEARHQLGDRLTLRPGESTRRLLEITHTTDVFLFA